MADGTAIEWSDASWNPIAGCDLVSAGCTNCYAMKMAARLEAMGQAKYAGLTRKVKGRPVWTGKIAWDEVALLAPLSWTKPRKIFLASMSDIFHPGVTDAQLDMIFAVMALTPHHTYMVLTKRPDRQRVYLSDPHMPSRVARAVLDMALADPVLFRRKPWPTRSIGDSDAPDDVTVDFPLPNVWAGTSVEDQSTANERIPLLLDTPAAVRWISAEPLLEEVDLTKIADARGFASVLEPAEINGGTGQAIAARPALDLVVPGGESGPRARPTWVPAIRSIVRQCREAGVPVFVKQMGSNVRDRNDAGFEGCGATEWHLTDEVAQIEHNPNGHQEEWQGAEIRIRLKSPKGGDMAEWPEDLRVREYPR